MNRAVLGFEAIYQQEGLQLSEEQVQAEYESGVQVRRMMPAWTLSSNERSLINMPSSTPAQ